MRSILILLVCTRVAAAEPESVTVASKSSAIATGLSAGVTAVGVTSIALAFAHDRANLSDIEGLMFYGGLGLVMLGPASGHVYVGEKSKTRSLTIAGRLVGGLFLFEHLINPDAAARWKLPVGATLFLCSTLYDVFDAGRAARRFNTRFDVKVAPGTYPTLSGGTAPALIASGRF